MASKFGESISQDLKFKFGSSSLLSNNLKWFSLRAWLKAYHYVDWRREAHPLRRKLLHARIFIFNSPTSFSTIFPAQMKNWEPNIKNSLKRFFLILTMNLSTNLDFIYTFLNLLDKTIPPTSSSIFPTALNHLLFSRLRRLNQFSFTLFVCFSFRIFHVETFIFAFLIFCVGADYIIRAWTWNSPDLTTLGGGRTVMPLIRAGRATEAGNHFFITKKERGNMINFPYE